MNMCIEVSSRKRVADISTLARIGCCYQSQGRGRPVAGPSKCPPHGVIPTCIETISEDSDQFFSGFGQILLNYFIIVTQWLDDIAQLLFFLILSI